MNSIWNNNYSAFQNRFPQLAQMLPSPTTEVISSPSFWELTQTRNGMITASEKGFRLHSAYNPEREAISGISNPEIMEKSTTVFYGFGLGYHVIQWAKMILSLSDSDKSLQNKKLVLIEPDCNHFYAAMTVLDWTDVFKIRNLVLAIGCTPEAVLPLIEDTSKINVGNTGVSDAYFFTIPAFTAHAQEYFNTVQSIINRNRHKNEINAATLKKFGKLWCRNSVKNINKMQELCSVSDFNLSDFNLKNTDIPFFIACAGPSLEKVLPYIAEIKKRSIIICVETALRALLRAGIQPDFIIITDPQWWAYRHIADLKAPESILVTEVSTYPAVFRFQCKQIILCSSQFPIGNYFETKLGTDLGNLGTGGSVASSAWNMAHLWGASEIYTAGMDFAFPENKTHIKGSDSEETFCAISNCINTIDKFLLQGLFSANAQIGKNYKGNPVITDSRMKMFAWWFESRLAGCPETKTYTFCPEGLNTPGINTASLEDFISNYKDISSIKEEIFNNISNNKKTCISGDKVPAFKKLIREFPNKEFKSQFPFLEEYLK